MNFPEKELVKEYINLQEKKKQVLADKETELWELQAVVKVAQLKAELVKQQANDNSKSGQDQVNKLLAQQEQIKVDHITAL